MAHTNAEMLSAPETPIQPARLSCNTSQFATVI